MSMEIVVNSEKFHRKFKFLESHRFLTEVGAMSLAKTLDSDLQRSIGAVRIAIDECGALKRMREEGCSKLRMPAREAGVPLEAVLINTSGGLAGGDFYDVEVETAGDVCVTTQAAEKIYRSLGNDTRVSARLKVAGSASVLWLPQEAILFNGARLKRSFNADVDDSATLLAAESVVLGRKAMGETLMDFSFRDRWRIRREDRLVFADDVHLDGKRVQGAAALNGAGAIATVVLVRFEAEKFVEPLREIIGPNGGVSAWDGKLVARLMAPDGFGLRKYLIPALKLLAAPVELPKVWTL
jgi:urease accessory protein